MPRGKRETGERQEGQRRRKRRIVEQRSDGCNREPKRVGQPLSLEKTE